ncbi:MAG: hypothetical protein K8R21_03030 [Leptospira sp.]|nr:hypothetical protein [Leptospira sp.]
MKNTVILFTLLAGISQIYGEAVSNKAYSKRVELLVYLRAIEPIVKNYRGNDKDGKPAEYNPKPGFEGERVKKYNEVKKLYQEGLIYYYEESFVNAYRRFLEAQLGMEQILEELSQYYVETTEEILKSAIERKNENNPEDKNLVDISVEFSNSSKIREDQNTDRESPFTQRMYNPREYHYVLNKYAIEQNMALGYKFLGQAKDARIDALKVEKNLEKHQKLEPVHRKFRIEKYIASISRSRDARSNAINIFKLKYPYDNTYLTREDGKDKEGNPVVLEGVTMKFRDNPYANPKKLSPVFDLRIPEKYRRDATDIDTRVYDEEVAARIKLKWDPKKRKEMIGDKAEENKQPPGTQNKPQ